MSDELKDNEVNKNNEVIIDTDDNQDKLLSNSEELKKTVDKLRNGEDNTIKEFLKLDNKEKAKITTAYALLTQIAIQVIVIMAMMFFLGRWLDKVFNTSPLFMLLCLLLGMAAAFKSIYDIGMNQVKKFERHDKIYSSYKKYNVYDDDEENSDL